MTTTTTKRAQRAQTPPTERLLRVSPFAVRTAAAGAGEDGEANDGLTLDGYAAVFNARTLIDSWEGRFWEEIAPGSMKKTFREQTPKVQFDHGTHPMVGSMPIGSVRSVAEDTDPVLAPDGGAHVVARLFDNWLIEPVRDAIREGAVNGMSFRFSVVKETWRDAGGKLISDPALLQELLFRSWYEDVPDDELLQRTLREVRVPELGPVVWPAYDNTSVGVRSTSVTIDLAQARAGDAAERRKIADVLFAVDADESRQAPNISQPQVEGEGTVGDAEADAPGATAGQQPVPTQTTTGDVPVGTAGQAPAAADHPSARESFNVALDYIRARTLALPSQPPTSGLK